MPRNNIGVRTIIFKGSPFDSNQYLFFGFLVTGIVSLAFQTEKNLNISKFCYCMTIVRICFTFVNFFFIKLIKYRAERNTDDDMTDLVYYQKSYQMLHIQWIILFVTGYSTSKYVFKTGLMLVIWITAVFFVDMIYLAVFFFLYSSRVNPRLGVTLLNLIEFATLNQHIKQELDRFVVNYKDIDKKSIKEEVIDDADVIENDGSNSIDLEAQKDECIVCLSNYSEDSEVIKFNCGHYFHKVCIYEWFKQKQSCPLCRDNPIKINKTYKTYQGIIEFGGRRYGYETI